MDAYRLDSTPEAEELDLDGMLADGALVIEWSKTMKKTWGKLGIRSQITAGFVPLILLMSLMSLNSVSGINGLPPAQALTA